MTGSRPLHEGPPRGRPLYATQREGRPSIPLPPPSLRSARSFRFLERRSAPWPFPINMARWNGSPRRCCSPEPRYSKSIALVCGCPSGSSARARGDFAKRRRQYIAHDLHDDKPEYVKLSPYQHKSFVVRSLEGRRPHIRLFARIDMIAPSSSPFRHITIHGRDRYEQRPSRVDWRA